MNLHKYDTMKKSGRNKCLVIVVIFVFVVIIYYFPGLLQVLYLVYTSILDHSRTLLNHFYYKVSAQFWSHFVLIDPPRTETETPPPRGQTSVKT